MHLLTVSCFWSDMVHGAQVKWQLVPTTASVEWELPQEQKWEVNYGYCYTVHIWKFKGEVLISAKVHESECFFLFLINFMACTSVITY